MAALAEQVIDREGDTWRRCAGRDEFELIVVGTRLSLADLETAYGPLQRIEPS